MHILLKLVYLWQHGYIAFIEALIGRQNAPANGHGSPMGLDKRILIITYNCIIDFGNEIINDVWSLHQRHKRITFLHLYELLRFGSFLIFQSGVRRAEVAKLLAKQVILLIDLWLPIGLIIELARADHELVKCFVYLVFLNGLFFFDFRDVGLIRLMIALVFIVLFLN